MSVSQQLKNKRRQNQNRKYKRLIKDQLKKINQVLAEKNLNKVEVQKTIAETQKVLDKTARKGIIHPNKSARQKSKIQKRFNELGTSERV